ncbi:hypothetical protein Tco_0750947 [Tanacetum coccineum]|uniref:Uncharacterized protein n=1 Tax=Tanacetum coccineum TaxID=301880 RepID=A0ABQ4Z591_9ASTR
MRVVLNRTLVITVFGGFMDLLRAITRTYTLLRCPCRHSFDAYEVYTLKKEFKIRYEESEFQHRTYGVTHKQYHKDPVEGFNIFNSSKTEPVLEESKESELASQRKKEFNRKTKRDAIFRKQHNIHTSGTNIPSPLQDFSELRSRTIPGIKRIECKAHHNGPSFGLF